MTLKKQPSILITGANRGIGKALARCCAQKSWVTHATYRSQANERLDRVLYYRMDVTNEEQVKQTIEAIRQRSGHLDVLVNNAGVFPEPTDCPFIDLETAWWQEALQTNVLGTFQVIRATLPLLKASQRPRIVNMSSGASSLTQRSGRRYAYGASKAALNHMTLGLADEVKQEGICVVALSPGWVNTDMGGNQAELSASDVARELEKTIHQLKLSHSGKFLDRFGQEGVYHW